jgi:hypothetical protein
MAGDPNNAAVWANADVYIGAADANIPEGGDPFDDTWDYVGLLNGSDGFTSASSFDNNDFTAWGYGVIATARKNYKETWQFTALEDNETMLDLLYPGHDVVFDGVGGYEGDVYVPDLDNKFKIGLEVRSGTLVRRKVSYNYAQIETRGDEKQGEDDLASRQVTVQIYPGAVNVDGKAPLFHTFKGSQVAVASIDVTPATATKAVGATQQLTVVATLDNTDTETVTNDCTFTTSDPAKATVSASGLITAVATGSATITAHYAGKTDTCVVTVS